MQTIYVICKSEQGLQVYMQNCSKTDLFSAVLKYAEL